MFFLQTDKYIKLNAEFEVDNENLFRTLWLHLELR